MAKGLGAYFIFCNEKRAEARAHVEALAEPGQKISVATVAKRLGELWKALTDEKKQGYKNQVIEAAKAAAEEAAAPVSPTSSAEGDAALREETEAVEGGEVAGAEDEEGGKRDAPMGLPISLVKRIMLCDEDVQRMTSGAVRATARAAELFIEMLAAKALTRARQAKRKNLKFSDLEQVVRGDRRCVDMCLKDILCTEVMFAEARGETAPAEGDNEGKENEDTEAGPRPAKLSKMSKKATAAVAGVRPITSFFTK